MSYRKPAIFICDISFNLLRFLPSLTMKLLPKIIKICYINILEFIIQSIIILYDSFLFLWYNLIKISERIVLCQCFNCGLYYSYEYYYIEQYDICLKLILGFTLVLLSLLCVYCWTCLRCAQRDYRDSHCLAFVRSRTHNYDTHRHTHTCTLISNINANIHSIYEKLS